MQNVGTDARCYRLYVSYIHLFALYIAPQTLHVDGETSLRERGWFTLSSWQRHAWRRGIFSGKSFALKQRTASTPSNAGLSFVPTFPHLSYLYTAGFLASYHPPAAFIHARYTTNIVTIAGMRFRRPPLALGPYDQLRSCDRRWLHGSRRVLPRVHRTREDWVRPQQPERDGAFRSG